MQKFNVMIVSEKYKQAGRHLMHIVFGIILLICGACPKTQAQMYLPGVYNSADLLFPDHIQIQQSRISNQKWFWSKYAAVSAGTIFLPGSNAFVLSAPFGIQLNRQLNNNLYAFGGVYAAPTFVSFNNSFLNPSFNKSYPGNLYNPYSFGINPGIQMGLRYVNDAGTFSISGSIRAERSSYYPVYYPATQNTTRKR